MMLRVSTGERSGEEWSFRGRERRGGEEEEEEKKKSFVLCVEHERLKDLLPRPPPGLSHCEKERRGEEGGEDEQGEKKKKKDGSCGGEGEESVDRKEERKEIKRREKNEVVTPGKKDEDEDENKCGKKTCRLRFPSILGRKEIDPHAVLLFASSSSPERGGACGIGGTPRRDGKDNPHPSSHEQSATHAPSCCFHIDELSLFLTPPSSSALKHFSSCSSLFSGSTSSSSVSYLTPREENVEGEALMKNNSPLLHPVVCSSLSKVVDESDGHVLHGKEKRKEEEEKREGARRMGRKNDGPSCSYLSFSCSGRELEERERERKEEEEISSCAGDAKEDDRGRREGEENKILLKSLESVHTRSREREEEIEERLNKEKGREKKEQVKTPSPISSSHPVTLLSSPDKRESSSSFSFTHPFFMSPCPSDIDPAALHRGERLQAREKSKDEEQFFSMPSLSSYSLFSPKNEEEMEGRDEDDVEDKERRKRRRDMGDLRRRMSFSLKPSLVKRKERRGRFLSRAHCYLEGRHLLTLLSQYFTPSSSCVEKEVFPRPNSPFSFISSSFPSSPRHLLLPPHPLLSHSQPYHQQRQVYRHLAYSSSSCDFFHISFQQDLSKKEEQRGKGMERLSLFSPGIEEEERKKKKESRVVWFCTCANRSTKMLIYKMRKKKNERKRLDRKAKDHLIHFSLSIVSPCSFDTSAGSTSFSMISEVTLVSLSLLHRHKRDIFTRRQRRQGLVHESLHANHSSQDLPGLMKQCVQLPPLLRPTPMKEEEEEESASIRREHAREFSCEEDAERIEKKIPVTPTTTLSSLSCRGENIFFSCSSSSSSSSSASSTVSSQGESEEDRQKLGKEKEDEEVKEQEEEEEKPPETKEEDEEEGKERGRFQDGSTHSSSSSSSTSASAPMYILYLEPSPSSSLHAFLDHRSREVAEIYGADPAHCYPPHCSLSGFFNCSDVETVKKLLIHLFHDTNEDEGSLPDPRKEEETARLDGDRPGREEKSKEKEDREEEERKRMKKHGRDDGGRHERRREDSSCASSSASQVSQLFCRSEREKKEKRRGGEGRGEEKEDEEEMKEREAREIEMTGSSRRDGRKEDHGEERKQLARNKDRGEMKKMKKKKEKKKKDEEEVVQERRRLERGEDDVFYLGRCNEIHIERTRRGEEERLSRQKKDSELPAEKGKCQGKTSFQRDEVATSKKDMLNGIKSEKQRERNKEANLRRKENEEERGAEEKKKRDLKEVSEHHEERSCHSERSERGLQLVRNRTLYHTRVKTLQSSSILSEVHAEEEEKKKKDLLLVSSSLRHSYTTPATSSSYQATSLEGEGERREETREKTKKIAILEERKEQGEPEEHCPSSYLLSSCEEDKDEEEEERDSPVEIFSMDMREEARKQIQRLSRFSSLKERCEEGEPITILSSSSSFSSFPFISSFLSTEIDEETPPLGGETTGEFLPYLSSSFFPSKFYHLPSGSFSPLYLSRSSHPLQYHIPSIASSSCTSNLSNRRPCPHVNEEKGGEDGSCPFSLASPCWSTPSWDTSNLLSSSGVFQALREEKEEEERRRTTRRKENEKKVWKVHENEREIERKEEEECLMKFFSLHSSFSLDSSSSSSCLFSSSSHSSLHPRLGRLQQPYTRHHLSQASCLTISHFDSSSSSSVVVSSPPISASSLLILHKKKMKKIKKNKRRNSLCLCGLSSHSRCTDTATGGASSKSLLLLPSSVLSPDQLTSHTFSSSSLFFSSSSLFSSFSSGSPTRLESPPSPSKESLHTHRTSSPPPLALPSCCPSHQTLLRSSLCASSSFTREDGGVSFLRAGKEEGQGKRFLEGQEDEKNKKISFSPECVSSSLPPAFPYPYPYTCLNSLTFFSSSSLLSSHCETKGATGETHHEEAHYERSFYHDDPRLLQRNRNCIIDDGAHYRGAKQPHGRLGEREGESGSSDVGDLKKIEAKSSHRCRREKEKEQRWDLCEREEEVAEKTEERISFAVYTPYHESEGEEKNKKAWKTTEEKEKKNNEDEVEEKRKAHGMKVSQDKNARSHEREEKEEREEKKKKGGEVDGRCKEETHGLNKGGSPNSLRSYEKKKKPVYSHKSSKNSEREGEEEREEEEWKEKEEEEEEEKKKSCVISTDDGYVVLCLSTKSCLENRLTQLQEILRSVAQVHIRLKEGDHITLASQRTDKNMRESIKHFYEKFLHEREGEGLLRESTWDVVLYQLRRKARDYKTDGRHLFTEIIRFPAFLKAG